MAISPPAIGAGCQLGAKGVECMQAIAQVVSNRSLSALAHNPARDSGVRVQKLVMPHFSNFYYPPRWVSRLKMKMSIPGVDPVWLE
eukprot:5341737-Karenia_brevis.AAC.1